MVHSSSSSPSDHHVFHKEFMGTYEAPSTQLPGCSVVNDSNMLLSSTRKVTQHPDLSRGFLGLGALGIKTDTVSGKPGRGGHSIVNLASAVLCGFLSS